MFDWAAAEPRRVERAVQMLLRQAYPDLRSFDGSGGDGGRDSQLVSDGRHTVFEIKSFNRLTNGRRRQIEKSLRTAVRSSPSMTDWVLVLPINMTPRRPGARSSEEAWFEDKLPRCARGVNLRWLGLDWLDGQLAANPDLRQYLDGDETRLLELAKRYRMERDVLTGGVRDGTVRLAALQQLMDEQSPFWTADLAVVGGTVTSTLRAKVPEAVQMDPIRISTTVSFPRGDPELELLRGDFESTMGFGGQIELPVGLVTEWTVHASEQARRLLAEPDLARSSFSFSSESEQLAPPFRAAFQIVSAGHVLREFDLYFRQRTAGSRGITLLGSDAGEIATFEVRLPYPSDPGNQTHHEAGLNIRLAESIAGYDVDSLQTVFGAFAAAVPGVRMRLSLHGLGTVEGTVEAPPFEDSGEIFQVARDLERLGAHNGRSHLRFPADVTSSDVNDLRRAVRLLDGETVEHDGRICLGLRSGKLIEFIEVITGSDAVLPSGGLISISATWDLRVGDLTLEAGPAAFWAPGARLANLPELRALVARGASDEDAQAIFEPTSEPFRWLPQSTAASYVGELDGAQNQDPSV